MGSLYSQLKVAHHPDRIHAMRAGLPVRPVHLQLILSDLCNQDCVFCAYRMSSGLSNELFGTAETHNPNRKIPTEKAREIIQDAAALGVRAVQFTGGGEPTVHPDHLELFTLAQSLGMETGLVTNGVRLDPTHPGVLGMSWIRVSVDAGDPDTYARVRRVPAQHWSKMWANVEKLASRFGGVLGIGFVVTRENWEGVHAAALLAKRAGASNIRVGAVFSADGTSYYGAEMAEIGKAIAHAKLEVETVGHPFEVIDLFGRRIGDLQGGRPEEEHCGYQALTWYVGGDLNLYRCCNTAYTLHGKVGSLAESRLHELVGVHEPFDARSCRYCQFRGQNQAINALLGKPEHANFV